MSSLAEALRGGRQGYFQVRSPRQDHHIVHAVIRQEGGTGCGQGGLKLDLPHGRAKPAAQQRMQRPAILYRPLQAHFPASLGRLNPVWVALEGVGWQGQPAARMVRVHRREIDPHAADVHPAEARQHLLPVGLTLAQAVEPNGTVLTHTSPAHSQQGCPGAAFQKQLDALGGQAAHALQETDRPPNVLAPVASGAHVIAGCQLAPSNSIQAESSGANRPPATQPARTHRGSVPSGMNGRHGTRAADVPRGLGMRAARGCPRARSAVQPEPSGGGCWSRRCRPCRRLAVPGSPTSRRIRPPGPPPSPRRPGPPASIEPAWRSSFRPSARLKTFATHAATYSPMLWPISIDGSIPHDFQSIARAYSRANKAGC